MENDTENKLAQLNEQLDRKVKMLGKPIVSSKELMIEDLKQTEEILSHKWHYDELPCEQAAGVLLELNEVREKIKELAKEDLVNHPTHYNSSNAYCSCGRQIECIDVTRHKNFNVGNAIKYLWRCDYKGNKLQDLKKAIWYIQDEIKEMEKAENEKTLL